MSQSKLNRSSILQFQILSTTGLRKVMPQVTPTKAEMRGMYKSMILMFALLLSSIAQAQVKTGGGSVAEIDSTLKNLTLQLKENDFKCPSQGQRLSKDKDFVQIYLKLSLLKNLEPKSEACEEANIYLECVNDKKVRKLARKLKTLSSGSNHLATTYQIPQTEVDKIINFFSTLGETKGEDTAYDGDDL